MMRSSYRAGSVAGYLLLASIFVLAVMTWRPALAVTPPPGSPPGKATTTADAALPSADAGKTLIVGTKIAPPFVYRGPNGKLTGLSIALWNQVAERLDLKTKYVVRPLGQLISGLADGSLDVSVAALTVTEPREAKIDFSFPFYTTGLAIAVPRRNSDPIWTTVLRFFSWPFFTALATLAAVLLLVGAVVWLFERRRNPEEFGGTVLQGLGSGFWWAAVTMTTVGYGDKSPRTLFGRLVGLVWMFAAIIIISSFTAAIATSLTVGSLSSGISGVGDLKHARVVTVSGSAAAEALRARGIVFTPENTLIDALNAVAAGRADAAVYDEPLLKYRVDHRYRGKLNVLETTFDRQDYAFGLPEGSPLRESIDRAILASMNNSHWNVLLKRFVGGS